MARFGDREALWTCPSGRRWTYAWGSTPRSMRWPCGLPPHGIAKGDRVGIWSPNCAEWRSRSSTPPPRSAPFLVNVNPAYRTHELAYALGQSGVRLLISATAFKTSDYRAMITAVRPECPALEMVWVHIGTGDLGRTRGPGSRCAGLGGAGGELGRQCCPSGRSDQHPVHLGHDRLPQGRTCRTTTSSTTGFSSGRPRLHRGRPDLAPGAALSLLRDGDRQPRRRHPRRGRGHPGAAFDRRPPWRRSRRSDAPRSTACRRCSSPSRTSPDFAEVRPEPPDGYHGGLALPGRGDEAVIERMRMSR